MANTATPGISSGEALLARVQGGWRPFRDAVGALPIARFDEPTPAGWTLKEMIGHVAYWEATVPPYLDRRATGTGAPPTGDVDEQNARAAAEARDMTPDEVMRRWDDAHATLLEALARLSDDAASAAEVIEKVAGDTYDHYPEHYAELTMDAAASEA